MPRSSSPRRVYFVRVDQPVRGGPCVVTSKAAAIREARRTVSGDPDRVAAVYSVDIPGARWGVRQAVQLANLVASWADWRVRPDDDDGVHLVRIYRGRTPSKDRKRFWICVWAEDEAPEVVS